MDTSERDELTGFVQALKGKKADEGDAAAISQILTINKN